MASKIKNWVVMGCQTYVVLCCNKSMRDVVVKCNRRRRGWIFQYSAIKERIQFWYTERFDFLRRDTWLYMYTRTLMY